MSNLLEDYLYSDKIHDGLITNPAKIILDSMINYNKLKNEQAKKINQSTAKKHPNSRFFNVAKKKACRSTPFGEL